MGLHVIGINDKISLNIIIKAEFLSDIIGELYYYFLQNRSSSCFDSIGVSLPLSAVSEKNKSVFLFFQHWLTLKTVIEKFFAIKYMNFGSIDVYRFSSIRSRLIKKSYQNEFIFWNISSIQQNSILLREKKSISRYFVNFIDTRFHLFQNKINREVCLFKLRYIELIYR